MSPARHGVRLRCAHRRRRWTSGKRYPRSRKTVSSRLGDGRDRQGAAAADRRRLRDSETREVGSVPRMTDDEKKDAVQETKQEAKPEYEPPAGAETKGTWGTGRKRIEYTATAK